MMESSSSNMQQAAASSQLVSSPRGFSAYNRSLSNASNTSTASPPRSPSQGARQYLSKGGPILGDTASPGASNLAAATREVHVPLDNVDGRVFERLARFRLLPPAVKLQSDAATAYLMAPAVFPTVFEAPSLMHRAACWSRNHFKGRDAWFSTTDNPRVTGARLLAALRRYLKVADASGSQHADLAQQLAQTLILGGLLSPEREKKPERTSSVLNAGDADLQVELLGVFDDRKHWYELVAPSARAVGFAAADDKRVSVWDVADGAIRAGFVFRKPPGKHTSEKVSACNCRDTDDETSASRISKRREAQVYVVVNGPRLHELAIFDNDVARSQIALVPLRDAIAQYAPVARMSTRRTPRLCHGLQVWHQTRDGKDHSRCETLDFVNKQEQERWLRAILDAGAKYREVHLDQQIWGAPDASFYTLEAARQHRDGRLQTLSLSPSHGDGEEILRFETLRGRIVLVVNMPTKEPPKTADPRMDIVEQLRDLIGLADRFGPDGLTVLVFPCSQFSDCDDDGSGDSGDSEGGIDDATEGTVTTLDTTESGDVGGDSTWSQHIEVLAPIDTNGPKAHPAYLFLNARKPGRFGPCVDGDYCKFLVNRRGEPVERFAGFQGELVPSTPEAVKCNLAQSIQDLLRADSE